MSGQVFSKDVKLLKKVFHDAKLLRALPSKQLVKAYMTDFIKTNDKPELQTLCGVSVRSM